MSEAQPKVAVVTGGGTGIGLAIASRLGRDGYAVAICGRREVVLKKAAAQLEKQGVRVFQQTCDVGDPSSVEAFFKAVGEAFGRVDCLVNNAGGSGHTSVQQPADRLWRSIIRSNVDGLYYCTSRAQALMPDGGRIVNISSVLGKFGVPGYAAYCSSKHAAVGFTRSAALELAPRKITVNALCPGWVDTEMARQGMERGAQAVGVSADQFRAKALNAVPLKEMIVPEEVADLVAFLAGSEARNITGQSINICGGQVMY